jgi:hypothetical protein
VAKVTRHSAAGAGEITPPARLAAAHDLSQFDSGKPLLDDWLKNRALESEGRTARTYVVCEKTVVVVGYYCIATGSVERKHLPRKVSRQHGLPNQVPVAIIGRLARQHGEEWKGLGGDLLKDALIRISAAAEIIGVRAVLVHALDEEAATFWRKNEFIEFPAGSRTFYLPVETIIGAVSA